MSKRVLLAGLFHETHTFLEGRTTLADFQERVGDELRVAEGDGSPLSAMLEVARSGGWDVLPAIDLRATPGPTVEDRVVDRFWTEFETVARRERTQGIDGVCLVLHGAMVSQSLPDVEGEILSRVRGLVDSGVPICGVLDLHGNYTAKMSEHSQGMVAYRQNPHADAHAAARDGALLLDRLLRTGEHPVTVWSRPPVMWPPTGTGTAFEPMRTLEKMARDIEAAHEEILAVNVFGGFSFADTPDTGVAFSAVTLGAPRYAEAELQELSRAAFEMREQGNARDEPLNAVMQRLREYREGPIVIAEPADNVGGGAPGDGTVLLQAFIDHNIKNAAVILNDPAAVTLLSARPLGERLTVDLGGKGSPLGGAPLRLEVELVSVNSGYFALEDRNSHLASMCGSHCDMGRCAVVRHKGVTILITSRKTPPFDLGQWRSQGIDPEKLFAIGVKAAVAHRRVYDPIARAHHTVETPGPCSSNLQSFPFRRIRRPIYPLDDIGE